MNRAGASQLIKRLAQEQGFDACGISAAGFLEDEAVGLEKWLNAGFHGTMSWMEGHFDERLDPRKLVPGAKSVISVVLNYFPEQEQKADTPKISKYAYGRDYHKVVRGKLKRMLLGIQEEIGEVNGRGFVDSAPVMDRAWARKSGLGWVGKHSLLLSKGSGSFFFIGALIVDIDLEPDGPTTDHCGSCTACIDACPTSAIVAPTVVDSNKCISYLTIEYKEALPSEYQGKMENWVYGCDICQDVCPWNRFSTPHSEEDFNIRDSIQNNDWDTWEEITHELWEEITKGSAMRRVGFEGFKRNLGFIKKKP
ncbi:tRNA epoxyqueuosine(34) reductase QueG [Schleiferiaceae bacterium]|nr:tRNA epoxyqueuosine(34) reductase QueG [Flavobacteriales bacterium]MDC1022130.1 tRNA epoxyqueuosine(34) reductase QueG [Schleiferiaceae bacterium]|tara:strand:+ start:248 stop:1174 length:927 start_codon:yes stop_codon:yes gene_type:complete